MIPQVQSYDFSSKPKAVGVRRKKYRGLDEDNTFPGSLTANIMTDKRVIRGNTYAVNRIIGSQTGPLQSKTAPVGSLNKVSASSREERPETGGDVLSSHPYGADSIFNVKMRQDKQEPLDLSKYLIEQAKPTPILKVADTQTAEFEPRPPTAPFIPAKTGIDQATQMYPDDGLFVFDREVGPLLAVLVGKTLQQAVEEVQQEAELEAIRNQLELHAIKQAEERKEIREMELVQAVEWEKKEKRRKAERLRYEQQRITQHKIIAYQFIKEMLPQIREDCFKDLDTTPAWEKPEHKAVRTEFLPWLFKNVTASLAEWHHAQATVDELIDLTLQKQLRLQMEEKQRIAEEKKKIEDEKRRQEMLIRIFIDGATIGLEEGSQVGPIELSKSQTIEEIEREIQEHFKSKGIRVEVPEGGFLSIGYNGQVLERDKSIASQNIPMNGQLQIFINNKPEETKEDIENQIDELSAENGGLV